MKYTMKMPCFRIHLCYFSSKPDRRPSINWAPSVVHAHTLFQVNPSLSKIFETLIKMFSPLVVESEV